MLVEIGGLGNLIIQNGLIRHSISIKEHKFVDCIKKKSLLSLSNFKIFYVFYLYLLQNILSIINCYSLKCKSKLC